MKNFTGKHRRNTELILYRGKISEVSDNINNKLVIKVEDTLAGRPSENGA